MKRIILIISIVSFAFANAMAQISGPTPVNVGTTQNYTFSNGIIYAEWYWEAVGGTVTYENLSGTQYQVTVNWTTVSTANTIKLKKITYNIHGAPVHAVVATKTIDVQLPTPNATFSQAQNCGYTVITRTNNPSSSLYEWWWQTSATGTSTTLGKGTSDTITTAQNLYLRSRLTNSPYTWSTSSQSLGSFTVNAAPALATGISDDVIYASGTATISASPQGGDQVKWYSVVTGGTAFHTGTSYTTPTLTTSTQYYIVTRNSTNGCESLVRTPITITVVPLISPAQVETERVRIAGITKDVQTYTLTNVQRSKQITYFDGVGRTMQHVGMAASPKGYDIVQPVEYDSNGRSSINYLPYADSTANGLLKTDYKVKQSKFYGASNDKIANDTNPYNSSLFEESPLGRVLEAGGVGAAWKPGTGNTKRLEYTFNTSGDNVRKFNTDGSSSGYYAANKLYKTVLTDENDNLVMTFADDLGRTVLKRTQLDEVIDGVTVNWLDTYTVYDDFGLVKYTISPKGVAALQAGSWTLQSIKDQYVYEYVYDVRGRVIEKKVPGQAWMYYGYDDLNRLVLTQDGLLRNDKKWLFIKYDQKGRAVMQGLYKNTVDTTRALIQTVLDGLYTTSNGTYGENAWYETRGTTLHGYTNTSFPKTNKDNSAVEILSVNFYDTYDFDDGDTDPDYTYTPQSLSGEGTQGNSYGRSTGSKRLVLGTSTWLYSYVFYDARGRAIQVRSTCTLL